PRFSAPTRHWSPSTTPTAMPGPASASRKRPTAASSRSTPPTKPFVAGADMANVKGSALIARFRFVEERFGEAGLKDLLRALPAEDRRLYDSILLPSSWYPFGVFIRAVETADRLF